MKRIETIVHKNRKRDTRKMRKKSGLINTIGNLLREEENLAKMENSILAGHSALLGVINDVEEKLKSMPFFYKLPPKELDTIKQNIGAEIAEILEEKGYRPSGEEDIRGKSELFVSASKYEKI